MPLARRLAALLVLAASCQAAEPGARTAALGGEVDGGMLLTWVDVVVSGCPRYDPARPACEGPGPLALRFAAISPAPPQSYVWTFGDGSPPVSTPAPLHSFAGPGEYTVTVTVGGTGGSTQATRAMYVKVTAAGDGEACAAGRGCGEGLTCICPEGCPGLVGPGFCAARCDDFITCPVGQVCVDPGPRGGDDGWPRSACVRGCSDDATCGAGQRCRFLPAAAPVGGWARGCFPSGPLGDEGEACRDGGGTVDHGRCLARGCADLGARGLCAASCDGAHPCPSYATCVTFATGERRCLVACSDARPCTGDPFLACEVSDSRGDLGFTAVDPAARLFAPRRCEDDAACGPDGRCQRLGTASFCLRKEG